MSKLRIIGDVHQYYDSYFSLAEESEYSLQVGDMGINYEPLKQLDSNKHKFIGGNHDNYDTYNSCPHVIESDYGSKDYGIGIHGGLVFFFVRGSFSIDWRQRTQYYLSRGIKTYWEQEELSMREMYDCFDLYKKTKPDFVISHDCPRSISKKMGNGDILAQFGYDIKSFSTRTSELLEAMFQYYQPENWCFGHYHKNWSETINGTNFRCIDELAYLDIET